MFQAGIHPEVLIEGTHQNLIMSLVILICGMIILGLNFGIIGLAWSFIIATSAKTVFLLFVQYKNKNGVNYVRT